MRHSASGWALRMGAGSSRACPATCSLVAAAWPFCRAAGCMHAAAEGPRMLAARPSLHGAPPGHAAMQVSDIADCVRQQADALMLCGETAAGAYPLKSLEVLRSVATRIEEWMRCEAGRGVGMGHSVPPCRRGSAAGVVPGLAAPGSEVAVQRGSAGHLHNTARPWPAAARTGVVSHLGELGARPPSPLPATLASTLAWPCCACPAPREQRGEARPDLAAPHRRGPGRARIRGALRGGRHDRRRAGRARRALLHTPRLHAQLPQPLPARRAHLRLHRWAPALGTTCAGPKRGIASWQAGFSPAAVSGRVP